MRNNTTKKILFASVLLQVILIAVLLPRFDREDIGPIKQIASSNMEGKVFNDSQIYVKYVDFFRNTVHLHDLIVPYVYRPAIPLLASFLPFRAMTSINLINTFFLSAGLWILLYLIRSLQFHANSIIAGGAMYAISFPTFYYGSVGYVDASIIAFLFFGITAIYKRNWFYFSLILVIGALVKESIITLIPVAVTYLILTHQKWKIKFLVFALAFLIPTIFIRIVFAELGPHAWLPSMQHILENIRSRAIVSNILTFGVPGLISIFLFTNFKERIITRGKEFYYPLIAGCLCCFAFVVYSFLSAYADGRPMWTSYVFTIPLSLAILEKSKLTLFSQE